VCAIANGISVQVERGSELESEDWRDPGSEIDRQGACVAALGPLDAVRAYPDRARHLADAQPRRDPRARQFTRDALPEETAAPRTDRRHGFATSHVPIVSMGAYPALILEWANRGSLVERTGERVLSIAALQPVRPTIEPKTDRTSLGGSRMTPNLALPRSPANE
jgi:hypothetical protein